MIDITKPLELSDGTPCYYKGTFDNDIIEVLTESGNFWHFYKNGVCTEPYLKLTLRNVKEAPKMENDLAARMAIFVRTIIEGWERMDVSSPHLIEARAIIAELDGPKTDEEWASYLREEYMNDSNADGITPTLLKAIAKGRELERMNNTVGKS